MESSSDKIRQSSYNHAASPRQDPPARGREKAVAAPVRAARRADQGRPARARRAAADRARAHTGGPCKQDGGARGGGRAARRGAGGDSPRRRRLCFRGTAAGAVPHRSRAHAVARRHPQRHGAAPRRRDRIGRPRRRARLARSGTRHRRRPGRDRSRCRRRKDRRRRGPGAAPRHRRGDRQRRVSALSPVHRPAPDPAPHGERAARADGRPARLPCPHSGRASQDLPGDRAPRSERGARGDAPPPHPLARALPTPRGATQSSVVARILLTHSPEALALYYGERSLAGLKALGEVKLNEKEKPLEGEALIAAAADCDLIVSYRQSPAPAEVFQRLPKLLAFVRCAIDIRNIDVAAASKAGVLVTQASAGFVTSVAEMVLGFMVDLSRGITRSTMDYRAGRVPKAAMGKELRGGTLGIIGYGAIGREVSRMGRALGMRVLVNDPYVKDVEQTSLDELLRQSDYVVPLATATGETENLMNAAAFAKMKQGAIFINASRGNIADEQSLEAALDAGRLSGCAMDVGRAPDQMPTPRLAARRDVITTPHAAGLTPAAIEHQSLETVAQAGEILKGRAPKGAVNAEHWTRKVER